MNTKTIENIVKTVAKVAINLTNVVLVLTILADLVSHVYGYDTKAVGQYGVIEWAVGKDTNTWLVTALTILTNSAMIYGLAKLKHFIANFTVKEVLADKTYRFLKQASLYTFFVSFLQNFLSTSMHQAQLVFDFSICAYFCLAFLLVKYLRGRHVA
ncbi:hypothetical protein [Streptococcus equinus]|uniref:Uncharacterized protein n=1 Tax=Streptococcus equinus TaxID=1335 RepID=A0A1H0ZF81_STREI|nr:MULTISPECIES: hypothetical protein [Streptococcus]SDQ26195.1 hypothetical protein SAMN05216392_1217 [Streptococcus equinus]SDW63001.1 hypothetical protein SAMN05216415_1120 [Streptococcus equinus]